MRGHLETMVLSVLERGQAHGMEIINRLEQSGCGLLTMKEGSLYPALYRLEGTGKIEIAKEEQVQGKRGAKRRIYRITRKGKRQLVKGREEWASFVHVVGSIVGAPA